MLDENSSLESALLKTKVLAYRIKNDRLTDWVNSELDGYKSDENLPEYRIFKAQIIGTLSNRFESIQNSVIPLLHLDKGDASSLTRFALKEGISGLEYMLMESKGQNLIVRLPPEIYAYINHVTPMNGYFIEDARKEIGVQSIKYLLSAVKSRLMGFLLELESQFEINLNISNMKENKDKVSEIVNYVIYGNNNVVQSGDGNKQKVTYTITQNNIDELKKALKSAGVAETDVEELAYIVQEEKPDSEKKEFGPRAKEWVKKMTGKAVDGTWQVSIAAAGQIVANALAKYYGF
ncbi:MAG: hypothetical protein HGB11_11615 [Chlorobiales bacterium]|nr:hypothetical protein [Chlorobiales bacterium]